jgi:hypothetical protein
MAGLNRSMWPTVSMRPAVVAAAIMRSASSRVAAIGFSTRTLAPDCSAASTIGRWSEVGATTLTRSSASPASMADGSR